MEDKTEGMKYKFKDPKTGEVKEYEVSYSQVLQERIDEHLIEVDKELKRSNLLKICLMVGLVVGLIMLAMILSGSGTIGEVIRRGICPP